MAKKFYITTPIYYPSDVPHIGTAYATISCDVLARYRRMLDEGAWFLTGSDEHGQKIEQAAAAHQKTPHEYVDYIVEIFKNIWKKLNISNDDFIRTTEERHTKVVEKVFLKLLEKGDIYKGYYEGWYCISCETFWLESQLVEKKCANPECRKPVEWVKEESYFFRLSKYADALLDYIGKNPDFIQPLSRKNETISFINSGLQDLCISRRGLKWGVPIPGDDQYSIYVWLDALTNYISAAGYLSDDEKFKSLWPADIHMVGKDIIRFHCIIWPAVLMALELPLPKTIFAHGWIVIGGEKISKSKGGYKNLLELIDIYGADQIRFFFFREATFGLDMEFSEEALIRRINTDLANDLGNLINRTIPMVERYCNGEVPHPSKSGDLEIDLQKTAENAVLEYKEALDNIEFRKALSSLWNLVDRLNKYIDESAPWALAKAKDTEKLNTVLYSICEGIRLVSILIYPFIPASAEKMWIQLGLPGNLEEQKWQSLAWGKFPAGIKVKKGEPIFPRVE